VPARANRHGLIAGATGTGKTVTVQRQLVNKVATQLIRGVLGGLLRGR
jgi:DNA helicase HerA-like ATPase